MALTSLAVALAAILLAFAVHLRMRFRAAREQIERLAAGLARCEAALADAPCGYIAWSADGREYSSAGLGPMIGLDSGTPAGWNAVRSRLAAADAGLLDNALAELWRGGSRST